MNVKSEVQNHDMLSIVFANRNKAYGAYQLRRLYPQSLGRALGYGLGLIILIFAVPYISTKLFGASIMRISNDGPVELGPPPDIDRYIPPPAISPPPPPTPPPTRTTEKYVPPIVKKDDEVADEKPPIVDDLLENKAEIGAVAKTGNDDAPPSIIDNPQDLGILEPPKATYEDKIHDIFDLQKEPGFPGGEAELLKYLRDNTKYPPLARENNIQGVVAITFVVGKDGKVLEVKIVKDIGGGCGKEALRVLQKMPKWIPGEANGNPVKVRFTLPVRFKLE